MAYYRTCPLCGSNLDAGEHCDCVEEKEREEKRRSSLFITTQTGQIAFRFSGEGEKSERSAV